MTILLRILLFSAFQSFGLCLSSAGPPSSARPIPITVLGGFLGSGKTTLLQQLLENNQGLRIAVIVNDVASVNIDAKLVSAQQRQTSGAAGLVELQNGCACCSLSEELLASVSELVTLSDMRGDDQGFHHIVIELSGVADPRSVRAKFQEAVLYDMPLMERVRLDTMVTLVDCSVFLQQLANAKSATPEEAPELFYRDGQVPPQQDWEKDLPGPLLEALLAGERVYGSVGAEQDSGVVDLLVSQCEIADVVLLNKVDLASPADVVRISSIVAALNPRATLLETQFGRVPMAQVLAVAKGKGVVEAGVVDDHKDAVQAALAHAHDHELKDHVGASHEHSHECNDPSHSHSHDHACNDPSCTDPSHAHEHAHSHEACDDPLCMDTSHSHDHNHFDLGTYVYRARRPFHPSRLVSFMRHLPISRGLPDAPGDELAVSEAAHTVLQRVLRSKGFVWCADSNVAAMYWSHAGTSLDYSCLGRWWATLPREQWPSEATPVILSDFDTATHNEMDPFSTSVGDRRQELVFIGPSLSSRASQTEISHALDQCLLTDDEWSQYCRIRANEEALREVFPNPIQSRIMSY